MPVSEHKMTDEQKAMYTGICMCRNAEVTLRWQRSQILILVNLAGFSFLGTQRATQDLFLVIAIAGVALCLFWLWINKRTQQYINYWQEVLSKIEPSDTNLLVFRVFTGTGWKTVNKSLTFYGILNIMPFAFIVIWIVVGAIPYYEKWLDSFLNLFRGGAV